jgi:hypothetical protein
MKDIELRDTSKMTKKELESYCNELEEWVADAVSEDNQPKAEVLEEGYIAVSSEDILALHSHYAKLLAQKMAITPNHRSQFAMMGTIIQRLKLEA